MSRKFVILRTPDDSGPEPSRGADRSAGGGPGPGLPRAGTAASAAPQIEVGTTSAREARDLLRGGQARAIAPAMPVKLIEPVATPGAGLRAADPVWGIGAVGASTSPFTGQGVVVAVLDTGIDPAHAAFAGVQLERRNFTSEGPDDSHGHGTHCAGTIFGREVDGQRIGVAPGVTRAMIGKVLGNGGGGSDIVAEAIQWAVHGGAHVISMSLGIDFPGYVKELLEQDVPPELATSMALEGYRANVALFEHLAAFIAARAQFAQPSLLIAAAGNESQRDVSTDFEIGVSPPATAEGIVSVAALQQVAERYGVAPFSNTGARISAPGVGVLSAKRGGGLIAKSGTSMATPHVAGVVALWAHKLIDDGDFRSTTLQDQLFGSASRAKLQTGFDPNDVGAGMAQAPQG